MLKLDKKLTEV